MCSTLCSTFLYPPLGNETLRSRTVFTVFSFKKVYLSLAVIGDQTLVHDPGCAGTAFASGYALTFAAQFVDDGLYQGLLDVRGIGREDVFFCAIAFEDDVGVCEDGGLDFAFGSRKCDAVVGMVGVEVPDACSHAAAFKFISSGCYVFGFVRSAGVERIATGAGDGADEEVEDVDAV